MTGAPTRPTVAAIRPSLLTASIGFLAFFPTLIDVLLVGLEFLVAVLQAYVFAILTCLYLQEAVHLH